MKSAAELCRPVRARSAALRGERSVTVIRRPLNLLWPAFAFAFACGTEADLGTTEALLAEEIAGDHPECARPHRDLSAADTDGDGSLSDEERTAFRAAKRAALLAEFDADDDGELSAEERAEAVVARRHARFEALDTDASESLSPEEVADRCRLESAFDRLDTNEDGELSADEFGAATWRSSARARRARRGV